MRVDSHVDAVVVLDLLLESLRLDIIQAVNLTQVLTLLIHPHANLCVWEMAWRGCVGVCWLKGVCLH